MTTLTATKARNELFHLIKKTSQGHQTYRIHHRDGSAVLMSEEDYDNLMETLHLLSIPGFKTSIKKSIRQMQKGETRSLRRIIISNSSYRVRHPRREKSRLAPGERSEA